MDLGERDRAERFFETACETVARREKPRASSDGRALQQLADALGVDAPEGTFVG